MNLDLFKRSYDDYLRSLKINKLNYGDFNPKLAEDYLALGDLYEHNDEFKKAE